MADENLEPELVERLRNTAGIRVEPVRPHADDRSIWNTARSRGFGIVTSDPDFWNDATYPLSLSPGLLLLSGRSAREKAAALRLAFERWDIIGTVRRWSYGLDGSKVRATSTSVELKFEAEGLVVRDHWSK